MHHGMHHVSSSCSEAGMFDVISKGQSEVQRKATQLALSTRVSDGQLPDGGGLDRGDLWPNRNVVYCQMRIRKQNLQADHQ
jgi:hypothetical protein